MVAAACAAGAQERRAARRPSLPTLAWIAGHWIDDADGDLSEEVWTAPAGDSMIGMWRYAAKGRLAVQELLSIADHGDGPVLRLRHFDPKMVAREEKDDVPSRSGSSRGRRTRRSSRVPACRPAA